MQLKKLAIALAIAVLIIVIAAIAIIIYQSMGPTSEQRNGSGLTNVTYPDDTIDQYGLNGSQKSLAVAIANTYPDLQEAFANKDRGNHSIEAITPLGTDGRSGYSNSSDQYLKVSVKFGDNWAVGENRGIVVDMDTQKVVGWEQYFRSPGRPPYYESAVIPPGAYWYHILYGAYYQGEGVTRIVPHISFEPADAIVYPIIVDRENFNKFKNGTKYQALSYVDFHTNASCAIDGSKPIPSEWLTNVSIPDPRFHGEPLMDVPEGFYYIILKNGGNTDVKVSYESGF